MDSAAVDLTWLNGALRASLPTDHSVTGFTATPIGTGQVGENVRFELEWDTARTELPASVVGKFPSSSPLSRQTAVQLDTYTKEIGFYRDVAHRVEVTVPDVHHLEWDPASHEFVLLMADVRPATVGNQLAGGSLEQAQLAVDEAVGLHAPLWSRTDELRALDWLDVDPRARAGDMAALVRMLAPGFADRYRPRLGDDVTAVASALADRYETWSQAVAHWADDRAGWCLVHGDFRLDNMLFGATPDVAPLTIVDWQTVSIGIGPADIAYHVGAGLDPAVRGRHEHDLVERYGEGLRRHGVIVDDATLWDGYVLGSATGYLMAVIASQVVERTERGDEMFAVMAERHAEQIETVGLLDRL
ncbi:MAG: phosphotransferase [Ilumatobacter sp.]|nr:phosphotransferase [Ilumatobacter sp.]